MVRTLIYLITCCIVAPGLLSAQDTVAFPQKLDAEGFTSVFAETGKMYISGQPNEAAFAKLKDLGVTTVVNLRTDQEMANRKYVPFDEKMLLDSLGLEYVHIPVGGEDTPYNREALDKFAAAVAQAKGKVLLHCTVGWRASHMWAAYLIAYRGMEPGEAMRYAKAINFGDLPLEGLLGKKLHITFE
jgi:uncharacterized protein (TIGR01244 family)